MTATPTEPRCTLDENGNRRWRINPDVIDSPACSMPQYADYRRHYYLVSGSIPECSAETLEEILDKGRVWAREGSRIVRVPVVPYYDEKRDHTGKRENVRPVGTSPWAGGTWTGRCGSMIWVPDPDHRYRHMFETLSALNGTTIYMQDGPHANADVGMLQAWWVNGGAKQHEPVLDGFWVECQQHRSEHSGLCTALDLTWDWRHFAPYTDQGHNTQLTLDLTF